MGVENLATARVLVVDDDPLEAMPIIAALSRIGVGCVYVTGEREEDLPDEPFSGIRLVLLDMQLGTGGEQHQGLSKTVSVLDRCILPAAEPFVIVCWTKHKDQVPEFTTMARATRPGLLPEFVLTMPKPPPNPPVSLDRLLDTIQGLLATHPVLGLLWHWEHAMHSAATTTSDSVAAVAVESEQGWDHSLGAVCRALVKAVAGHASDTESAPAYLMQALNEMAVDGIRSTAPAMAPTGAEWLVPSSDSLSPNQVAALNGALLLDRSSHSLSTAIPGSVYLLADSFMPYVGMRRDLEYLKSDILNKPVGTEDIVLVEISPPCDYYQNKLRVSMFVAGVVSDCNQSPKSGPSIYSVGPCLIPGRAAPANLLFSFRHVYADSVGPPGKGWTLLTRLRTSVVVDLQAKAAAYRARPGVLSVEMASKRGTKSG